MILNKWYNTDLIDISAIIDAYKNNWYNSSDIIDIIVDFWHMI